MFNRRGNIFFVEQASNIIYLLTIRVNIIHVEQVSQYNLFVEMRINIIYLLIMRADIIHFEQMRQHNLFVE